MSRRFSYKSEVDKLSAQCFAMRQRCLQLELMLVEAGIRHWKASDELKLPPALQDLIAERVIKLTLERRQPL